MSEIKNRSRNFGSTIFQCCSIPLSIIALFALFVGIIEIKYSDSYVWNFTDSKEDVYKYIVLSRKKITFEIDDEYRCTQDRIEYLYNHTDSLVFDSLLTEILRFRTKDGCLKDYETLWPVMDWCKVKGKKITEMMSLRDSFYTLKYDTTWIADLYGWRRKNKVQPFMSLIDVVVCYMVADSLSWKDNVDVYDDMTTCKTIRRNLFERLAQNGHYSTDSSSIPDRIKSHQCLFSWNSWSGFELNWGKGDLGYVLQNDTVCEIISLYGKRHDTIDRYSYSIIDRYYYGIIKQEDCDCNHFWHDRMVSKVEIENPSDCFHMRNSIFSNITSSSNVTYHQKRISHFE